MIITKTPTRVSLLGGSTDYPSWSREHGGITLGGAINKFSYVMVRRYPPFHDHKTRVVYSRIEEVGENHNIEHKAVNACIRLMGMEDVGLEVVHSSDLPGRSGTGSSSTFVVGVLHALGGLQGRLMLPAELTMSAIQVEQQMLGETVGCQDQTFAAYGGLKVLEFRKDGEISVRPLALDAEHVAELERHLMLFFTKLPRVSSEVAQTYATNLNERRREQFAMMRLAQEGIEAIYSKDWQRLGKLIDQSWRIKSSLSEAVTNEAINSLYADARLAGAFGGKLTGAGGGGCLLLVAEPEKHKRIIQALPGCVHIPFRFDFGGSSIIYSEMENLRAYRPA